MPEIQEEEIDLREYINVLLKRKGIIILIFLIAVITAAIASYFMLPPPPPPTYQSTIVLSVAKTDNQAIINLTESLEIIKSSLLLDEVINRMGLEITSEQLTLQIEVKILTGTNFIKISVVDDSPEKAITIVENITEVFVSQNQRKYQENTKLVEDRLKNIEEQIVELGKNIQEIEKNKKIITSSEKLTEEEKQFQISLLLSSLATQRMLYNGLSNLANSLIVNLRNYEDFKIISCSQLPITPIKPNKKLNILIAGVLGLFVGIFVAFFLEFWQKGKS